MIYDNEVEILLVDDNMSDEELTIRALKKNCLANKLIHRKNGVAVVKRKEEYGVRSSNYHGRARTMMFSRTASDPEN